jgi:hypothetical protein
MDQVEEEAAAVRVVVGTLVAEVTTERICI